MKTGVEIIAEERQRQIETEGWAPEHDDQHTEGELADAACSYAMTENIIDYIDNAWGNDMHLHFWPFDLKWLKRSKVNRIEDLAKAGALIAAEIDRIQRMSKNEEAASHPAENAMKLTSQNVQDTFMKCLFEEGEDSSNHVKATGIVTNVGFHPERLKSATNGIIEMINELPDAFKQDGGGGWTLLNLCLNAEGEQWADDQKVMDQLVCLGIAAGKIQALPPRDQWNIFPGGMPYITILK